MASNREADFTTSVSRKISTQSTHGKATMHSQKLELAVGGYDRWCHTCSQLELRNAAL